MQLPTLFVPLFLYATNLCPVAAAPQEAPSRERRVAILVYHDVELLDFAGPGEVFSTTHGKDAHAFSVYTVGLSRDPVKSQGFVTITPQYTIADCPKPDIIVVPGGHVPAEDPKLQKWVQDRAQDTEILMSVCNGALLFARAGLLRGLEVTSHKSALQSVAMIEPTAKVFTNRRFVDNGRIITVAGVSSGIDGALHVVQRLHGEETAWQTARYMEYDWRPDEIAKLHAQPGKLVDKFEGLEFASTLAGLDDRAALAKYKALEKPPTQSQLNQWGYRMLAMDKRVEALTLLRLAAAAFPASANAADSLAEAYEAVGDGALAKRHAEDTLARLDKEKNVDEKTRQMLRNSAASRVARLSGKSAESLPYVCPPCGAPCDKLGFLEAGTCPACSMALEPRAKAKAQ